MQLIKYSEVLSHFQNPYLNKSKKNLDTLQALRFTGLPIDKQSLANYNGLIAIPNYKNNDEEEQINLCLTTLIEFSEDNTGNINKTVVEDALNFPLAKKLISIGEKLLDCEVGSASSKYYCQVQIASNCPTEYFHLDDSALSILLSVNGQQTITCSKQMSDTIIKYLKEKNITQYVEINNKIDSTLSEYLLRNSTSIPYGNIGVWNSYQHENGGLFHASPSCNKTSDIKDSRKFMAVLFFLKSKNFTKSHLDI